LHILSHRSMLPIFRTAMPPKDSVPSQTDLRRIKPLSTRLLIDRAGRTST
jgi:hypothetical protein